MTTQSNGQGPDLYRGFTGILMTLITMGVVYLANNSVTTQVAIAHLSAQQGAIQLSIEEMKEDARDAALHQYTRQQAEADWRLQATVDQQQSLNIDRSVEWNRRNSDRLTELERIILKEDTDVSRN